MRVHRRLAAVSDSRSRALGPRLGVVLPYRIAHRERPDSLDCRNLDDERAALARRITDLDISALCTNGLSGNRQPQSQARSIFRAAFAEGLEQVTLALRNPSAFILDFDGNTRFFGACPQGDPAASPRVLEGVAQQVGHGRCQELLIDVD